MAEETLTTGRGRRRPQMVTHLTEEERQALEVEANRSGLHMSGVIDRDVADYEALLMTLRDLKAGEALGLELDERGLTRSWRPTKVPVAKAGKIEATLLAALPGGAPLLRPGLKSRQVMLSVRADTRAKVDTLGGKNVSVSTMLAFETMRTLRADLANGPLALWKEGELFACGPLSETPEARWISSDLAMVLRALREGGFLISLGPPRGVGWLLSLGSICSTRPDPRPRALARSARLTPRC